MPFMSPRQEYWMMINAHEMWVEWVRKYGHHPKFKSYKKKIEKKESGRRKTSTPDKTKRNKRRRRKR